MSKFFTPIPVDVQRILDLLPRHTFIHGIKWNAEDKTVEIHWEHDRIRTKYTFPVKFEEFELLSDHYPSEVIGKPEMDTSGNLTREAHLRAISKLQEAKVPTINGKYVRVVAPPSSPEIGPLETVNPTAQQKIALNVTTPAQIVVEPRKPRRKKGTT